MDFRSSILVLLLFSICVYALDICFQGFRRTRGVSRVKPYLYALGAVLTFGVIGLILFGVFVSFVDPLH